MLIELDDIHRVYQVGGETVHALRGVNIGIDKGEWVAIIGQSGSGKSTLMNVIGCLDTPTGGSYRLNGKDVSRMSRRRARRHPQSGDRVHLPELPAAAARDGAVERRAAAGVPRRAREGAARAGASRRSRRCGLEDRMTHKPNELSGGQRQRVAIARALAGEPSLLLADEPTGNLDSATGEEIVRLFEQLHRQGHTLVLVTHEPRLAARCPRAIRLSDGQVVADGPGPEVAIGGLRERRRRTA